MELTDDEVGVLHELLVEAVVYNNPEDFNDDDRALLSSIMAKVMNEAKNRKFWWAR